MRKQAQPYTAEFPMIEGVRWTGQIICGHNPWLLARLVDNLIVNIDADGNEAASWTDRVQAAEITEQIRQMRGDD
ncbi:hypothetical protein [Acidobacterium sp. S8]|uniref:hypothetical protein n=1 Tax=Acidobacterium sp. S8 TaxID=1641854 RepID=UPI00131B4429|nr:hypothetical protein [Acidobacterium sp. S8]